MLTEKKIGVLMGGQSAEREVSLRSGNAIYNALKGLGYRTVAIDAGSDLCSVLISNKIEIAFLALHVGYGEDGSVQGMLEVLGIPYTGSKVLASALAMDKDASKKIFIYHDIPVPPFIVVISNKQNIAPPTHPSPSRGEGKGGGEVLGSRLWALGSEQIDFPLPWVVKPATEGSSVGVSIVRDKVNLREAVEKAGSLSEKVMIEKYIEGKEIHIGILDEKVLGGVEVRPSLEFYSYEAKYTAGLTEYILPPEIDSKAYEKAKDAALSAHSALGCKGATRVDLRVDGEGNPYVLEVNTIPGMTETSLLPKIARHAGLDFPALIEEILRGAIDEG
ncbi:MAG: D-alanine--D-alanine ligase [Nitrospirae bacterium]|nr:D-alanine--D-alanine ligase [Nitrospirota bacterium]